MRTRRTQTSAIATDMVAEELIELIEAPRAEEPEEQVEVKPTAGGAETKAEAFKRVANFRLDKTIARMRQFPALANTGSYEYTQEQVDFILDALNTEVADIDKAFRLPHQSDIPQL